jgi:hypothetical protein
MEKWLPKMGIRYSLGVFMTAGLFWAIWKTRNKIAIEKKFPKTPTEVISDAEVVGAAQGGQRNNP